MALQSSGAISLNDIQNQFGGSNPISLTEYYGADDGIPGSGTISASNFYGKSKPWTANYNVIAQASIAQGAGGTGEGFWREVSRWTNNLNRKGSVRLWGDMYEGYFGPDNYGAWYFSRQGKQFGYRIYQNSTLLVDGFYGYYGNAHPYWDFTAYVNRNDAIIYQMYGWGGYGQDKVGGGTWRVGGS